MKVTRINDDMLAITIPGHPSFTLRGWHSLGQFTFETPEAAAAVWALLLESADELGAMTTGPKTAELEMLSNRIDELESTLDGAMRHDASSDRDIADELEQVKVEQQELRQELEGVQGMAMCEAEVSDMIEEATENLEIPHDDHVHDLISDYIVNDGNGMLRRRVLEIVSDKLRFS